MIRIFSSKLFMDDHWRRLFIVPTAIRNPITGREVLYLNKEVEDDQLILMSDIH